MSDVREKLTELPPRLNHVGTKLLNWIEHTMWEHGHHADEALLAMAEEILRLRAHLGRREQYLLDETALHPTLPARSDLQFGHAIHADTCTMCADDAGLFERLEALGRRSEAARVTYVSGTHDLINQLGQIKMRAKVGGEVPTTAKLVDAMLKALDKLGARARKAFQQ
ncbi:hypothetical protein E0H26_11590 [Micromonospora zingiberis]|uniref:Uncharacterized protein n=1 Tax=Micromonospora zingiberis TaxID=2053011 RepID=A0A4R0GJ51_9ACTN|nr:hypothetical protein [Micromonospora zingiberis]TCB97554.1 hypothetical protein E0H26_11590 [Micromonospora zingiberis]